MGELLGEGSFGRVFKVTENQTGKVFACKQVYKNKVIVIDYIRIIILRLVDWQSDSENSAGKHPTLVST